MPKAEELVSSPPLLFCPPPRRTYDYLQSDDEIDCAEPRRSLESSRSHAKNKVVTPKEGKAESAAVKLKRRSTQRTQKHSKQDLATEASCEDFSAAYWQDEAELDAIDAEPSTEPLADLPCDVLLEDLKRQGPQALRAFRTALAEGREPLQSVKLCMVGHARAGKTSTLLSLTGRSFDPNQRSTHGVETHSCSFKKELWSPSETSWEVLDGLTSVARVFEEKVAKRVADTMKAQAQEDVASAQQMARDAMPKDTVMLIERAISGSTYCPPVVMQTWDFAGQEMYYCMAHVFLTALGIYVLVLDLSAWSDSQPLSEKAESIDFWLAALLVHASDAWLVVVGSHADELDEAIQKEVYLRVHSHLSERLKHKKVLGNQRDGLLFFPVDNRRTTPESLRSVEHLRKELSRLVLEVAKEVTIPTRWAHLFHLLEGLPVPSISLEECQARARSLAIEASELESFLGCFHRLGQLLYFKGSPAVVLTPQWLLDAMAQVVACPVILREDPLSSQALKERGLLSEDLLKVLWEEPKFQQREVLQSFLEHFDLLVPENEKEWMVPSLLPRNDRAVNEDPNAVSVYLDFKGTFQRLLTSLIPRLLCQLRKRQVVAEIPFSADWRRQLEAVLRRRRREDYDVYNRLGEKVAEGEEDDFPLEVRHRQELKVFQLFKDFAKFAFGKSLVTLQLFPLQLPELLRVTAPVAVLQELLDSIYVAMSAWLPHVSYSTGLPCPCGFIESGHLIDLSKLMREDTTYCERLERLVDVDLSHWRMEPERNGKRPASQGVAGSWRFMYSSPLDWQKRSLPQLAIAQELDALCEAPWRVQVASHEALQQVLAARPAVLHLSAHSVLLAQGETRRALLLEDAQSHGYLMEAEKLKALGPWQDLGLLVLLTCSSFELVKDLGCRAVCCTDQVKDAAASEFLRSFYHFLPTSLLRAFEAGQDALRFGPDAGLRSEAEKFILLGSAEGIPVPVKGTRVAWPRLPRVEDYRCQAHTMADMVDCLSKNQRRVILLRGDEGSGKTATCREFCHHFSGPGRLFGLGVLYLETKEQSSKALSEDALRELFIKAFPLPCDGTRCCLLVLDNIDILEAQEQEELRKSLAGLLRSFHSLRVLLTSRCPLQGWACLDSWKVVEIEIMTLPPEDSACLFLQRCRRPLHHRDFQEDGTEEILQGSCAQQRLQASGILKALNGVPGHIVRAAGCVDALLPSLLEHPMLRPEP